MSEQVKKEDKTNQPKVEPKDKAKEAPKGESKGRVEKIDHPSGEFTIEHL